MNEAKVPIFTKFLVRKYVHKFYENVLRDKRINSYFDHVDMELQKKKQTIFLYQLMTNQDNMYLSKEFMETHHQLREKKNLNENDFKALIENFQKTCSDLKMPESVSLKLINKISSLKNNIFL